MYDSHRLWAFLSTAVGAVIAFAMLYLAAVGTRTGQYVDHRVMLDVSAAFGIEDPTVGWLGRMQTPLFAIAFLITAVQVVAGRSIRRAGEALGTVVVALIASVACKAMLERPSFGIGPQINSFPSNTVALVAALAVVSVAAAGVRYRAGVLLAWGVFGTVASIAVVALQWHRPADVAGAWLMAVAAHGAVRAFGAAWTMESARTEGSIRGHAASR